LGSGLGGVDYTSVSALAVSGSDLYAAGYFTRAGNVSANYIAKWNGSRWSALASGTDGFYPGVSALALMGNNLYAGGSFVMAGGKVSPFLAQAVLGDAPGYNQLAGSITSGGAVQLSYTGDPGTQYALDRTFNLEPSVGWLGQQTNTMSTSGVLMFTSAPVPGTNNFWRVRSVP
jgi:hypothetical protein